jgi:concanavalin A-like lectin/glucanase superfamily protein
MSFLYRATFNVTSNSSLLPSSQSNYSLRVSVTNALLKSAANGGPIQNTDGGRPADLVFTSDFGFSSVLSYECDFWDPVNGIIDFWAKQPTLSLGMQFFAGIGDAAIATFQGGAQGAAWDTPTRGVFHLPDGTTLALDDSASFNHDLTKTGTVNAIAAKINGGASIGGADGNYLEGADTTDYDFTNALTLSAWVKTSDTGNFTIITSRDDIGAGARQWQLRKSSGDKLQAILFFGGSPTTITSSASINDNAWHHVALTYDGSNMKLYIDGVEDGSTPQSGNVDSGANATLKIGSTSSGTLVWNGGLDEIRIAAAARSADWIKIDRESQHDPGTFVTASFAPTGPDRVGSMLSMFQ